MKTEHDNYNRETLVRFGNTVVRVPDIQVARTRKTPAELALEAYNHWLDQYADFVQRRFEHVA